jgi:hypothetical protein
VTLDSLLLNYTQRYRKSNPSVFIIFLNKQKLLTFMSKAQILEKLN